MSRLVSRENILRHAREWGHPKELAPREFLMTMQDIKPTVWVIERGRVLVTIGKEHASHHIAGAGEVIASHDNLAISGEALEPTRVWEIPFHLLASWRESAPHLVHTFTHHTLQHAERHLRHALDRGTGYLAFARELATLSTLQQLGSRSLDHLYELIPSQRRALVVLDVTIQKATVIHQRGFDDMPAQTHFSLATLLTSHSTLGEALRTGRVQRRSHGTAPHTVFFERPEMIVSPLVLEGRTTGSIVLADPKEIPYNDQHEKILEGIASMIAGHVGRLTLQDSTRAKARYTRRSLAEIR